MPLQSVARSFTTSTHRRQHPGRQQRRQHALGQQSISGRDLVLLGGGLFLLYKATGEIHGRLEGHGHGDKKVSVKAGFWVVVTQIIVLDAVFSLDAVITAVGMSDHLPVMMAAVAIAIFLMIGFALSFSYHLLKKIICRY